MILAPNPHHYRSTRRTQTSSFRAQSRNPSFRSQNPNFVIPCAVGIQSKPAPSALHYGYCDFAQYDGVVWRDGVCEGNPNFVIRAQSRNPCPLPPTPTIPEVPAAPKYRHSARSRGIHLRLPTHQPEKPAPSALHYGYCDFAQYDGVVWGDGVCGNG